MKDFMTSAQERFEAVAPAPEESQEVVADRGRASDIVNTMATPGWRHIVAEAEAAVREQEEAALGCEDDTRVLRLQHEARAAREFLRKWTRRIDAAAQITPPQTDFQPVAH